MLYSSAVLKSFEIMIDPEVSPLTLFISWAYNTKTGEWDKIMSGPSLAHVVYETEKIFKNLP